MHKRRSGRAAIRRVSLWLAVTKVFPAQAIRDAYALGLRDFGENYVQEFVGKLPELAGLIGARFHLIGHLQANKSRLAAEMFDCIQTVDSAKLARRLNETGKPLETMLEVKLSPEQAKAGADAGGAAGSDRSRARLPEPAVAGPDDNAAVVR